MTETQQIIELLTRIEQKLSGSPITSGLVDKDTAIEMFGFKPRAGKRHIEWLRHKKGVLSKPEGSPQKYYVTEILVIRDKLRHGEIQLPKTYNKAKDEKNVPRD